MMHPNFDNTKWHQMSRTDCEKKQNFTLYAVKTWYTFTFYVCRIIRNCSLKSQVSINVFLNWVAYWWWNICPFSCFYYEDCWDFKGYFKTGLEAWKCVKGGHKWCPVRIQVITEKFNIDPWSALAYGDFITGMKAAPSMLCQSLPWSSFLAVPVREG